MRANQDMFNTKVALRLELSRGTRTEDELVDFVMANFRERFSSRDSCRNAVKQHLSKGETSHEYLKTGDEWSLAEKRGFVTRTNALFIAGSAILLNLDGILYLREGISIVLGLSILATILVTSGGLYEFLFVLKVDGRQKNGAS